MAAESCLRCGAALETEEDFDERLVWALRHPDTEVAMLAAELLGARGSRLAIPALLDQTRSPDPYRAATAAQALGAFVDDERVRARLQELASAPSVIVRRAVTAALAVASPSRPAAGRDRRSETEEGRPADSGVGAPGGDRR